MNKSAKITEFDLLKYEQLYLNSQDSTEYKDIIENIQYDPSFTKDTREAVLGIIHETKISANLNGFISQLIDFNQVSDEAEAKQLLNDNDLYETSLFKQHIKSG
ncbi:hypothetical protein ABDK10_13370 [Staphylococcus aureus]